MTDGAVVDIRRPLALQIEFEVLSDQYPLNPNFHIFNEEGACVFITSDSCVREWQKPRARGVYRSTVTIPGNFLSEGMFSVDVAISTLDPVIVHVVERGLLCFSVHDAGGGDSARGVFAGPMPGAVRPMLQWSTERLGTVVKMEAP